jgi:hypothetical protein
MMNKKTITVIIVIVFVAGILLGKVFDTYFPVKSALNDNVNTLTKNYYENDAHSLIHIKNPNDVIAKRNALINYIWHDDGFPTHLPTQIDTNIYDENFSNMVNLKQIDKITIEMENNIDSIAYLLQPEKSNDQLVIYHQGHDGGFIKGKKTIELLLQNNYSVLAFSMPLLGINSQPLVELENQGTIKLTSHNQFFYLDSGNFTSIRYFVEPIAVSINYIDKNYAFNSYNMVGISGGGWTTTLYSAIDPRITQSYSVAGSLPLYLRTSEDLGDYEQILPDLYKITNYLELYVLDSYGDNRKHVQIFNKYDPCCFSGKSFQNYEDAIQNTITELQKGSFKIYLDDTHREHKISDHALKLILKEMKTN